MTLTEFLEHWSIVENPFMGEEARHDAVFTRLAMGGTRAPADEPARAPVEPASTATPATGETAGGPRAPEPARAPRRPAAITHPDFDKVFGDPGRPASSIVFGEKGSGKTAMRLQIERRVADHNAANFTRRALLVAYDDLNPVLDPFCARLVTGKVGPEEALKKLRHLDHIDALLSLVVPRLTDAVLSGPEPLDLLGPAGAKGLADSRRAVRKLDAGLRRDLVLLQSLYDRTDGVERRTRRLRRLLRLPLPTSRAVWTLAAWLGWIPAAAAVAMAWYVDPTLRDDPAAPYVVGALGALWLAALAKRSIWDRLTMIRLGRRVRRQLRVVPRSERSYGRSLGHVDPSLRTPAHLPMTEADEPRYAMVRRLRRLLGAFGYASIIIVVDRVDEPTLVRGDPERMRAVVWPLFNNKLLQQEGFGLKLLLPIELRHLLFKESGAFFQEARLDKQNLVERLAWTGPMLYDLCDARLNACRAPGVEPITLLDLFAEDVTRQDVTEALGSMQQPRDAFKLMYQCLSDHCASASGPQPSWRIPRPILEMVRKLQVDRVQQLYRGIRPA
ncbi:MAG: hypothetical protein ACKVU4_03500 [Phycisphaerales bacterium]